MSGFLCVFGPESETGGGTGDAFWRGARERLAPLGTDRWQVVRGPGGGVGLGRFGWEDGPEFSGDILVAQNGGLVVAADASLYYRDELRRELLAAGAPPRSLASSDLILAAYRAWGAGMCARLEGDFAFVVWDRETGQVLAARDLTGRRGLFFARRGDWFAVGSSVAALLELPFVSHALNLPALGAQVAGLLWSSGSDTAYRDVQVVPAAHAIRWDGHELAAAQEFWAPPAAPAAGGASREEASQELRGLIEDAVQQRLASSVTSVWLSGGWDSSAVFAAGQARLADRRRLRPVSISYPEGDPGREDDIISAIAARWDVDVHWLDSERIPLLDDLVSRAGASDEPPAHLYELWNVALAHGTRAVGARVALDGAGGDQLFQVSDIVMADLLRSGHWARLVRHVRARHVSRRRLLEAGVLPLMPRWALRAAARATGRRVPLHYVERPMSSWVRREFVAEHALRERELAVLDAPDARSLAQAETALFLLTPIWGWGATYMHGALLRQGVEARSPLLDRRVVDFALRRPVEERSQDHETKILLRRSMTGLLPDEVLAPRRYRTGMTIGFSRARMRAGYPALFDAALGERLRLAELGIVDPDAFRAAVDGWSERGNEYERVNLFHTLKVEFWLRGLERRGSDSRLQAGPAARSTMSVAG